MLTAWDTERESVLTLPHYNVAADLMQCGSRLEQEESSVPFPAKSSCSVSERSIAPDSLIEFLQIVRARLSRSGSFKQERSSTGFSKKKY